MSLNTTKKRMGTLKLKLSYNSSSGDINIVLAILNLTQDDLAKELGVTQASISLAINNDPLVKKLRERIIDHLNSIQFNTEEK